MPLLKQLAGSLHWSYMEESLSNFVILRLLKWSGLFPQLSSDSTPCCRPSDTYCGEVMTRERENVKDILVSQYS